MSAGDHFESNSRRGVPWSTIGGFFESVNSSMFPIAPVRISNGFAQSIEFRRKTESWLSFPYHTLISCEYHPHSCIEIAFPTYRVKITGRNLQRLYDEIRLQQRSAIEEDLRSDQSTLDDSAPVVEFIEVATLDSPR